MPRAAECGPPPRPPELPKELTQSPANSCRRGPFSSCPGERAVSAGRSKERACFPDQGAGMF